MTDEQIIDGIDAIHKDLFRMNGTLMKEGELGATLTQIAEKLEKMNWNLGTIAKALTKLSER